MRSVVVGAFRCGVVRLVSVRASVVGQKPSALAVTKDVNSAPREIGFIVAVAANVHRLDLPDVGAVPGSRFSERC